MSNLSRREILSFIGRNAVSAALAPRVAFGAPERGTADPTQETIKTLVEAGQLREGVGGIHWVPLNYAEGGLAPGQLFHIADYMNAAMQIGSHSRSVDTQEAYVNTAVVTPKTDPSQLKEINKIVAAMQVTAADVQEEFKSEHGLGSTDARTRYGANATKNPLANQIKFRLDAGPTVLYAHHPDEADNTTAITSLYNAWTSGQLDGVFIMTNEGEIRMVQDSDGKRNDPILRAGESVRILSNLNQILSESQLGSGDAQYLLSLVIPNKKYVKQALTDPGIGAELYVAPNTHSYEMFPVR